MQLSQQSVQSPHDIHLSINYINDYIIPQYDH